MTMIITTIDQLFIINVLGVAMGLIGSFINISPEYPMKQKAFTLWILSDLALGLWSLATLNYALLAMYSVYLFFAIAGWINNHEKILKMKLLVKVRGGGP